ncbi:hypothetical protein CW745_16165 [Psychromonas sp. psych-6C06]|uniref:thioredoxin family protein n=1 Tax=Psychromonas sp. psych-6C06 TaxID=2058089 RepID=UPI000C31F099|nr:thioredoxin domain-containing protein [Psychromonas sp. psych-6C06]PKF60206.1 hypothetical protein CW745_16165 [Psychromonas sp. psych-6C06]
MSDQIIVCTHCFAINDLQLSQGHDLSMCSQCEQPVLSDQPIDVDEELFNRFITHSSLPVLINFWGTWSGVSHEMATVIQSLSQTFQQDVVFLSIDSEQHQVLANHYKLVDIPTFILFKSGVEYRRVHGLITERKFHQWLERYLRIKRSKPNHRPSSV